MIINATTLDLLFMGFSAAFKEGLNAAPSHWKEVAMEVPSTTGTEVYAWLADIPRIREWLGERVINSLSTRGYAITNRDWESTVAINRPLRPARARRSRRADLRPAFGGVHHAMLRRAKLLRRGPSGW